MIKNPLIIRVGSTSIHKVKPVEKVCRLDVRGPVEVIGVPDIDSKVSPHPYGMNETMCGSINRAIGAWLPGTISVGIEGGIVELPTQYLESLNIQTDPIMICMAIITIMDRNKEMYFGSSSGMQIPYDVIVEAKQRDITFGMVLAERYGGDHTDPREILSFGRVHRCESIEEAVRNTIFNIL